MNLIRVEMRRALHRRAVWVLIVLALIGCAAAGVIAFVDSAGRTVAELRVNGEPHPAIMRDWWVPGSAEGTLGIASLFLVLGGLFGGATVAGAEWRAGTVTTLLTWEPRRLRVYLSRCAACAGLAAVISFALQAVFLASLLPAVLQHGSTADLDRTWWFALLGAMGRTSLLTALAAILGCALSMLGRNTAFALVAAFAWLAIFEGLVRGLQPAWTELLWAENTGTVLQWSQLENVEFRRGPVVALVTVVLYVALVVAAAAMSFTRRDIASAS